MTVVFRSLNGSRVSASVKLVAAVLLLGLPGRLPDLRAQDSHPIKDIRVPIERYPDGTIHRQLHAAAAAMSQTGPIHGQDVRVESFDPDGQLEMVVETVECEYDRDDGTIKSAEVVKARARGIVLTGKGFVLDSKAEQLRVLENVRVEFNRRQVKGKTER